MNGLGTVSLRLITDAVPAHVGYVDSDLRYRFVNNAYEATYGRPAHKIIGQHMRDVLGAETFAEALPDIKRALAGETVSVERRLTGAPIGTRYFIGNYVPDVAEDGNVRGFLVVVQDVTAKKAAEFELERARIVMERVGEAIYWIDLEGRIVYVNQAACDGLGYSRDELLNLQVPDLHPADQNGVYAQALERLRGEGSLTLETVHVTKQGRELPVEINASIVKINGEDLVVAFARNIEERKRTETALERAQIAMDNMGDAVRWIALDGRIVYSNRASCDQLGYTREELLRRSIPDIDPDFHADKWSGFVEEMRSGRSLTFETKSRTKDGRDFPVEVTANLMRTNGEELIFSFARDISARKEAEEALRRREEQLRVITDAVPVLIGYMDRDQRYTFLNRGYEKLTGRQKSELVGMSVKELLGEEAYKQVRPCIERALSGEIVTFERVAKHTPLGDRCIRVTNIPDRDEDGAVRGLFVMAEDLTEAKEQEQARQESEARFRAVFEEAAVGISLVDMSGQYISVNPAYERMMGYGQDELRSVTHLDLTHPDDRAETIRLRDALDRGEMDSYTLDKRYVRKSGDTVWARLNVSVIHDGNGRPKFKLAMVEDISERKHADERWKAILEHSPINIFVKDTEGRYLLCNRQFERYHGMTSEEIQGKTAHDLFPSVMAERFANHDRSVLTTGVPSRIESEEDVAAGRKTFLTVKFPIKDEHGNPTAIVGMETDITDRVDAERRLKKNETQLRLITDSIPASIAYVNSDLRYEFINKGCANLFGRPAEALIGTAVATTVDESGYQDLRNDVEAALAGKTVPFSRAVTDARGQKRSLIGSYVPDVGDDGRVRGAFALAQDVTALERAEEQFRESEAQLRLITNAIPAFIARVNADLRYVFVNKGYEKLFGRSYDELVGMTMPELLGDESYSRIAHHVESAFVGETVAFERELPHSELGSRTIRSVLVPDVATNGDIRGLFILAHDITERKQAEEARRESEARANQARIRLLDAIENLYAGFALFDADDQLVVCNSRYREVYPEVAAHLEPGVKFEEIARLYATSLPQFRGDPAAVASFVEERVEKRRRPKGSFEMNVAGGRWIRVSEHRTSDGGVVSIHSDITENKRKQELLETAKEQADQANRTKTEFLANMSHELRTPLNAIIGFSEIIENEMFGGVGSDKYLEYATDIRQSAVHLLDVISDILDIAKVEAGKTELEDGDVKFDDVVETCQRIVGPRALEKDVELTRNLDSDLPYLRGDRRRIIQVLLNLLSNAVKFTPPGGRVTTSVAFNGSGGLDLTVADTGAGIPLEEQNRVLEPFYQGDSALSRRHEGTGLGLALCKAFVTLHDGELVLESELGRGTVVTARFPAARVVYGEQRGRRAS